MREARTRFNKACSGDEWDLENDDEEFDEGEENGALPKDREILQEPKSGKEDRDQFEVRMWYG